MRFALELVAFALVVLGCLKAYDDLDRAIHDRARDEPADACAIYDWDRDVAVVEPELADVLLLPCAYEARHGRASS